MASAASDTWPSRPKIEDTGAGDYASPGVRRLTNSGKRSVRIDLKNPQGLAVLHRPVATAQVLVEGFLPGVMARLGACYGALAAIKPALVYRSITGYGQDGPYKDEPGHDINYRAPTGGDVLTGRLACYGLYATQDGRHVAVGALEDKFWHTVGTGLRYGRSRRAASCGCCGLSRAPSGARAPIQRHRGTATPAQDAVPLQAPKARQ